MRAYASIIYTQELQELEWPYCCHHKSVHPHHSAHQYHPF